MQWILVIPVSISICEREFSKQNGVESDPISLLNLGTLDALMRVPLCGLQMENIDWARIFDTWKSTKIPRTLPLDLDDD